MKWPSHLPVPVGVLFDLDGVIVDSSEAHAAAWMALFAEQQIRFDRSDYEQVAAGRSRDAVIREVLGDRPDHDILMRRKVELMDWSLVTEIPGTLDFVRHLDLPFAIATSSRVPELLLQAVGVAELFPVVVHRGMVACGKPAPDVFLEAAARLGLSPRECLVVEDSPAGVEAGRAAGCTVVGLGPVTGAHVSVQRLPCRWMEDWRLSPSR